MHVAQLELVLSASHNMFQVKGKQEQIPKKKLETEMEK